MNSIYVMSSNYRVEVKTVYGRQTSTHRWEDVWTVYEGNAVICRCDSREAAYRVLAAMQSADAQVSK